MPPQFVMLPPVTTTDNFTITSVIHEESGINITMVHDSEHPSKPVGLTNTTINSTVQQVSFTQYSNLLSQTKKKKLFSGAPPVSCLKWLYTTVNPNVKMKLRIFDGIVLYTFSKENEIYFRHPVRWKQSYIFLASVIRKIKIFSPDQELESPDHI